MTKVPLTALLLLILVSEIAALTLSDDYDPAKRPNLGGVADVVNVDVDLLAIRGVDEEKSEMTVDVSVQTSWVDSRLIGLVSRDTLFVNQAPNIWLPNVQLANADGGISFNTEQGQNYVLQLNKDGLVKLGKKVTARLSCQISLAKYPFDRQVCRLQMNSYGYSSVHLALFWHGTVSDNIPVYHSEFSFSFVEQTSENIKTANGAEFSNLYLEIGVTRCPLRVIFRAMLPSMLLLIFSYYMSFCHCHLMPKKKKAVAVNGNGSHHHVEVAQTSAISQQTFAHDAFPNSVPTSCSPGSLLNLVLVAINGMTFILSLLIAQLNFIESPKSSAVTGLDVWLNFVTAVIFVILWHRIQLLFDEYFRSDITGKHEVSTCYVNRTTNMLKLGIPPVTAVFLVIFFGIYLS